MRMLASGGQLIRESDGLASDDRDCEDIEQVFVALHGSGGLLGLFRSQLAALNSRLLEYNERGFKLESYERDVRTNLPYRAIQGLCLLGTLGVWCPASLGMLRFERPRGSGSDAITTLEGEQYRARNTAIAAVLGLCVLGLRANFLLELPARLAHGGDGPASASLGFWPFNRDSEASAPFEPVPDFEALGNGVAPSRPAEEIEPPRPATRARTPAPPGERSRLPLAEMAPELAATPAVHGAPAAGAQPEPTDAPPPTSIPADMVFVPAATFTMGAEGPDGGGAHARQVTISHGFLLDKTEVTAAAYARCVDSGACSATSIHGPAASPKQIEALSDICTASDPAKGNFPINCIDYQQAFTYCSAQHKRLPTEAEWELAARGTDNRTFPWGETLPIGCELAATAGCTKKLGDVAIHPQGAGPYGALDMAGNVWEWVADGWTDAPETLGAGDPAAPTPKFLGVLRGGSWDFAAKSSRAFSRLKFSSGSGHVSTGVRCARSR